MKPAPSQHEDLKVLVVLCLGAFLFFNSYGSINVALPSIQREFGSSLAATQWVGIVGLVVISSLSLCLGRVGDLLGRERLYKSGIALYALGSGLAATAFYFPQLIAYRVIMTIGLAMAFPMSAAILVSKTPPERRGWVLGWLWGTVAIGRATGPTVGGVILQWWGWRGLFFVNSLIGTLVFLAVFVALRVGEERKAGGFDYRGAFSLILGYPSLLIALSLGARFGWDFPQIPFWFALSAAGLIGFTIAEFRVKDPLINPVIFKSLPLLVTILALALSSVAFYPVYIFAPLYMQNVLGFSPLRVGLMATVLPFFTAVTSPVSGKLADRFEPRPVVTVGLVLTFLGLFWYGRLGLDSSHLSVAMALAVMGLGAGFFIPANQKIAFSTVTGEHYGVLSAMFASLGPAFGTVGIAIAVSLLEGTTVGKVLRDPVAFTEGQQFAFSALLPLALLAFLVSLVGRQKRPAAAQGR